MTQYKRFFPQNSPTTHTYTLSLHDALPILPIAQAEGATMQRDYWYSASRTLQKLESPESVGRKAAERTLRSEEHTSELQSRRDLVCRLLLEKKKYYYPAPRSTSRRSASR